MLQDLWKYKRLQKVANKILSEMTHFITESSTEKSLSETCRMLLANHDIKKSWNYDCPAIVLIGEQSTKAVSGYEYIPSNEAVGNKNLVTVELSPMDGDVWIGCSRSFAFENGKIRNEKHLQDEVMKKFYQAENELHNYFKEHIKTGMTYGEAYHEMLKKIEALGYKNIGYQNMLGHSIEKDFENVVCFENGNETKLSEDLLFTFGFHIADHENNYGFKSERMYCFEKNMPKEI